MGYAPWRQILLKSPEKHLGGTWTLLISLKSTDRTSSPKPCPCLRGLKTAFSGAFSTLTPAAPCKQAFFGVGTWNANGLFCISDYAKMCRKIKIAIKHIKKSSIFCVQEAHGNEALLQKHFRKVLLDYHVFSSFLSGQGSGGVLTFVSKKNASNRECINSEALVCGRVLKITISNPSFERSEQQVVYNVHIFGPDLPRMREFCGELELDIVSGGDNPLHRSLFVLGDFNFSNRGKFAFSEPVEVCGINDTLPPASRLLKSALAKLIEIDSQLPTRYDTIRDCGRKLDRVFCNLPPLVCTLVDWVISIPYCPKELYKSGMSDHTPVLASISKKANSDGILLRFPPEVYGHHLYGFFLDELCWREALHLNTGFEKLYLLKNLMRGAAELVRDHCQSVDCPEIWINSQTFRTMARIVWNQDHALAQSILERDVLAQTHLEIVNNKVMIKDFLLFTNESDAVNSVLAQQRGESLERQIGQTKANY